MRNSGASDGEDRISQLPNDILCHMLSFLPSKEAIATSFLSTRWRFLWTMVSALDFECTTRTTYERVNKFLSLRTAQRITRFNISCYSHHYLSRNNYVENWVHAAIEGKVEQMNVTLCIKDGSSVVSLPTTLFTCTTIVTLNLNLIGPIVLFFIPSYVHFPSLKTLHVHVDSAFIDINNLLNGSPSLEFFHLKQKIDICFVLLEIVRSSRGIELFERKGVLGVTMYDLVIKNDGDNDFIADYLEGNLENLVKVKAYVIVYDTEIDYSIVHTYVFYKLGELRYIEFLSLEDFRVWTDYFERPHLDLPIFQNLVELRFYVKDTASIFNMTLLEKCPKLQVVDYVPPCINTNRLTKLTKFI